MKGRVAKGPDGTKGFSQGKPATASAPLQSAGTTLAALLGGSSIFTTLCPWFAFFQAMLL